MSSSRPRDLPTIRDRIVELRRVKGRDLLPNPRNWRFHPQAQQDALKGVLAEIGFADALLARETPDGLMLIDGHLRAGISRNQEVPVLILDLDEQEADKLLATLDPLASMAQPDQDAGAKLYNEAILVVEIGSLSIRVGRQFVSGRKRGKTHQNVLVFVKGDPKRATEACGTIEVEITETSQGDNG